jgi:Flp pilus assembly protein TadD
MPPNACALLYYRYSYDGIWVQRARDASSRAVSLRWDLPEVQLSQAWVLYATGSYNEAVQVVRKALEQKKDCEGAYYLLCRALFSAGRYQEVADVTETALQATGEDYNVYVPILNSLGALGKVEFRGVVLSRCVAAIENHLKQIPEDARARILISRYYAELSRVEDAMRELNLALTLRANESSILYNAACSYCCLDKKTEAMDALRKAWAAGFKDATWARRDPDLAPLRDDPEFDRLYPDPTAAPVTDHQNPAVKLPAKTPTSDRA